MKLLTGIHLTDNEKRGIQAVINSGLSSGRIGRTDYFVKLLSPSTYKCKIVKSGRGLIPIGEELRKEMQTVTIQL